MQKETAVKRKDWKTMRHTERVAAIERGRAKDLSDEKIGELYGASKGQIVGYRHRHLTHLTGTKEPKEVARAVPRPKAPQRRTKAVPRAIASDAPPPEALSDAIPKPWWPDASEAWGADTRPVRTGAVSEAHQCVWNAHVRAERCFAAGTGEPRLCVYHERAFQKSRRLKKS